MAQRIGESLTVPFDVEGTEIYVQAKIGISLFPQDAEDPASLQRNAEAAMYEAKKSGSNRYVMSARGAFDSAAKLQFVTRLRKAVESQRWTLHYQPVVELATGHMVGAEALIRWIEPDGTMVAPGDFIPVAEELGLIEAIGEWVVRELVHQIQAWLEKGRNLPKAAQLGRLGVTLTVVAVFAPLIAPTHYAVAIRYEADSMAAPAVVAKGKNYLAQRIRSIFMAPPRARPGASHRRLCPSCPATCVGPPRSPPGSSSSSRSRSSSSPSRRAATRTKR